MKLITPGRSRLAVNISRFHHSAAFELIPGDSGSSKNEHQGREYNEIERYDYQQNQI